MKLISSFSMLILVFLFHAQFQETNAKGLISRACQTALNKDLCKTTLKSDPGSVRASMHNLAKIMLKAALANGTALQSEIQAELKSKSGTMVESALKDCKKNYNDAVSQLKESSKALENKRYSDVNTWVTAAMNDADSCEQGFQDAEKQSPICQKNKVFGQLCGAVLAVTNKAAEEASGSSASGGSAGAAAQGGSSAQVQSGNQGNYASSKGNGGFVTHEHAKIAIKAAIEAADKASKDVNDMLHLRIGTSVEAVLQDCRENYKSAVAQLKLSLDALDNKQYADVNVKVTAAMNDCESCEEGFKVGAKVSLTAKLNANVAKLCSSVLAIVNNLLSGSESQATTGSASTGSTATKSASTGSTSTGSTASKSASTGSTSTGSTASKSASTGSTASKSTSTESTSTGSSATKSTYKGSSSTGSSTQDSTKSTATQSQSQSKSSASKVSSTAGSGSASQGSSAVGSSSQGNAQAKVALKAALDNAKKVQLEINVLAESKKGSTSENVLKECQENFDGVVAQLTLSIEALDNKRYKDVNAMVTAAMNDAQSCDQGFKDLDMESPIANLISTLLGLCSNLLGTVNNLAAALL